MRASLLSVAVAATVLSACAAAPKRAYEAPAGGPTAELVLRNATSGRASVALYADAARCTGRSFAPDLLVDEEQVVTVPAGRPLAFTFRYAVPNTTPAHHCEVTASFLPEAGGRYRAAMKPSAQTCTVQMTRLDNDRGVDAKPRIAAKAEQEDGAFCLPQS